VADNVGTDNLVVILGTPTPDSSKLYALTVTEGDPSWAGPLAGVAMNLPVYHITEPQIKQQVLPSVYEAEVGIAEIALDSQAIIEAVKEVREKIGQTA
jgi:hypothetical protein